MSLRERKKQQTRETIGATAWRLFAERGFDAVTVAEIAREADVSEGTVFNYFPTKEDLVYSQMEAFEAELVEAVRARAGGESAVKAFRRVFARRADGLAAEERGEFVATAARIISSSPALQARQREIVDAFTQRLAEVIAADTGAGGDDVEPRVAAHALMGIQQALQRYVHSEVLAGRRGPKLAADVKSQGKRAFARLERGLRDYAPKP
jgi:AcrR family transcriptional regulator